MWQSSSPIHTINGNSLLYSCHLLPNQPCLSEQCNCALQVPEGFVKLCTPLLNSRFNHMMRFEPPDDDDDDDDDGSEESDDGEGEEGEDEETKDGKKVDGKKHSHKHVHTGNCCGHKVPLKPFAPS